MRRLIMGSLLCSLLLCAVTLPINAQTSSSSAVPKSITINQDEILEHAFVIRAGEVVNVFGQINGDLVVAGGQVMIDGVVNGDVLVVSGNLKLTGTVNGDVRAIGGQIDINGSVAQNLTLIGGNINVNSQAQIGGGVLAIGGNIALYAPIPKEVTVTSGSLMLDNRVGGLVRAYAIALQASEQANLNSGLEYTPETDISIHPQASIAAQAASLSLPSLFSKVEKEKVEQEVARRLTQAQYGWLVMSYLSALVVGVVLLKLGQPLFDSLAKQIDQKPFVNFLLALLSLFFIPLIILLLIVTLVGIPLAFVTILALILTWYSLKIIAGYWLGQKASQLLKVDSGVFGNYTLGLFIFFLLQLIPLFGWMATTLLTLTSFGALLKIVYGKATKSTS